MDALDEMIFREGREDFFQIFQRNVAAANGRGARNNAGEGVERGKKDNAAPSEGSVAHLNAILPIFSFFA